MTATERLVCGCGVAPDGAPSADGCCAECMQPEFDPAGLADAVTILGGAEAQAILDDCTRVQEAAWAWDQAEVLRVFARRLAAEVVDNEMRAEPAELRTATVDGRRL